MGHHRIELGRPLSPAPGADVLVLAGDIHEGTAAVDLYADYPISVIYVHGNHEPQGHRYPKLVSELEERANGTAVRFLQNEELVIDDVRFLGACLWTDYELHPLQLESSLELARRTVTDYRRIRRSFDNQIFQPEDARNHQRDTLLWLRERLDAPFAGKTVVVTHHLPSILSIPQGHRVHELAPAYASSLEPLVLRADLWVHGHVHASTDYQMGKCRVVCNPRGRPGINRVHHEIPYENASFNPALTIDL